MCTPYEQTPRGLTRREFLNVASRFGLGAVLLNQSSPKLWAKPVSTRYPFTLDVASGGPSSDAVLRWTRLAPDPLADGGMPMSFAVARNHGFYRVQEQIAHGQGDSQNRQIWQQFVDSTGKDECGAMPGNMADLTLALSDTVEDADRYFLSN